MTELTLRKAHNIVSAAQEKANLLERTLHETMSLSKFDDDPVATLSDKRTVYQQTLTEFGYTVSLIARLKTLINSANESAGVAILLTQKKAVERQIKIFTDIIKICRSTVKSVTAIENELKAAVASTDVYDRQKSVTVAPVDIGDVETLETQLTNFKRELYSIKDELIKSNVTVKIEIPNDLNTTIKEYMF